MIQWHPIADLPDALKDGRYILLWETNVEGRVEVVFWDPAATWYPLDRRLKEGVWCSSEGSTIHGVTHFAEINEPS